MNNNVGCFLNRFNQIQENFLHSNAVFFTGTTRSYFVVNRLFYCTAIQEEVEEKLKLFQLPKKREKKGKRKKKENHSSKKKFVQFIFIKIGTIEKLKN
jgi:hypothetical protein